MNSEVGVALAALLHDVGKLVSKSKVYRKLFNESGGYRKDESQEKSAGYYHAYIGAWWIENFAGREFFNEHQEIANIVAHHHRRDWDSLDKDTLAVILADWLASGERSEKEEEGSQFLLNAFYPIGEETERLYYKPSPLANGDYYPKPKEQLSPEDYHSLVVDFEKALSVILRHNTTSDPLWFSPLFESLYSALFNYCWAVPAQTGIAGYESNISLFSHSKLTSAIALVVYRLLSQGEILDALKAIHSGGSSEVLSKPLFSLIVGDISGIQRFIFNVPSKGAAKSLKGRSAYVDLLGEVVARFILKELDLSRANLLMFGGGGFQVLGPRLDEDRFNSIRKKVEEAIFKHHGVGIYISLSKVDLTLEDFLYPERYREKIEKARAEGALYKYRKYEFIEGLFDENLLVVGDENRVSHKRCSVCGVPVALEAVDEDGLCELCQSIVRLGNRLKEEGNFLIITRSDEGRRYNAVFAEFGFNFRFRNEPWDGALNFMISKFPDSPEGWAKVSGVRFLPKGASPGVEFQQIADKSKGIKKLGVLKIDVDNLGYLFGVGLGDRYTPSLVDTISNMLNVFFSLEVERILNSLSDGDDTFYLVFSGGDDSFLLGAWDKVLDAAWDIKQRFDEFVCNPVVTFSAAFTIVGDKTPMIRIAELAEERLDAAKEVEEKCKRSNIPPEKDRINVIGYIMPFRKGEFSFEKFFLYYKDLIAVGDYEMVKKMCNVLRFIYEGALFATPKDMDLVRRIWLFGYMMREYVKKNHDAVVRMYDLNQRCVLKSVGDKKDYWKFIYVLSRLLEFYLREEGNEVSAGGKTTGSKAFA